MRKETDKYNFRQYLSLVLLFFPPLLFLCLIIVYKNHPNLYLSEFFPFLPWQFLLLGLFGIVATIGGLLDWMYHRNPLNLKIPAKEREAESVALGLGGIPMFILMWLATLSVHPEMYLIPILIVLIYTVVMICYDEFVFHIKRCGKRENWYHRMLVFGNGLAWLSWMHLIFNG